MEAEIEIELDILLVFHIIKYIMLPKTSRNVLNTKLKWLIHIIHMATIF